MNAQPFTGPRSPALSDFLFSCMLNPLLACCPSNGSFNSIASYKLWTGLLASFLFFTFLEVPLFNAKSGGLDSVGSAQGLHLLSNYLSIIIFHKKVSAFQAYLHYDQRWSCKLWINEDPCPLQSKQITVKVRIHWLYTMTGFTGLLLLDTDIVRYLSSWCDYQIVFGDKKNAGGTVKFLY